MPQGDGQQYNLLEWAKQNYRPTVEILQLFGLQEHKLSLPNTGMALYNVSPQAVANLSEAASQRLLELFDELGFFRERPLPEDEVQTILMPGQPFPLAVEILRPLKGHIITCVGNDRLYDPALDGSPQDIAQAMGQCVDSRWYACMDDPQAPPKDQYELTALAAMVASNSGLDLAAASPERITYWNRDAPVFTHLSGNWGEVVIYDRYAMGGAENADVRHWMQLVEYGAIEFDTSGTIVIATSPMTVEQVGFHAQEEILAEWPDCRIYVTAPEIPESERPGKLPQAVRVLGAQLQHASYSYKGD